jgi:hypothetical protein
VGRPPRWQVRDPSVAPNTVCVSPSDETR